MNSKEMAKMAFGDPGFFDVLAKVGGRLLRGAVKSIPFVGGLVDTAIDIGTELLTPQGDQDQHHDDEEEDA